MATITLTGIGFGTGFGAFSSTDVACAFQNSKKTTGSLTTALNSLRGCINASATAENVDVARQYTDRISNREETKKSSITLAYEKLDQLVSDVGVIDNKVSAKVEKLKNDFYNKYSYLRPECEKPKKREKSLWEKFVDGAKNLLDGICDFGKSIAKVFCKAVDWLSKNWKSLLAVLASIVAIVVIVVLCVVTFGGMAVLLAVAVGVAVSLLCQLATDLVIYAATGTWKSTWEDYVGAVFGGVLDGALSLIPGLNVVLVGAIGSSASTYFTENLKNITGRQNKSYATIYGESIVSFGIGALFAAPFMKKPMNSLGKKLSKYPLFKRLSGRGSFDASYKMVLTKLSNKQIKNFTNKSLRNGIISSLWDGTLKNIFDPLFSEKIKNGIGGLNDNIWDFGKSMLKKIVVNTVNLGLNVPMKLVLP